MIQSPESKLIVKVKSKYISNFSDIMRIASLENNTSVHLEDLVNITAEVVSLPRTISKQKHYEGFSTKDIKVGDTIIMSFAVIYDHIVKDAYEAPLYKNLIKYKGDEFWSADIRLIFGVIKEDEVQMVNGYIMATLYLEDKIFIQQTSQKDKKSKVSEIMHCGNPKTNSIKQNFKQGDNIHFNPMKTQKYQINGKHFIILQQDKVLGISKK